MGRKMFQTEMEVTGRISVEPTDDSLRLKSVSTDDMQKELSKLKDDQSKYFLSVLMEKYYVKYEKITTRVII